MRLSVFEGDLGYHPYMALMSKGLTVDVMLDGEPLKNCITADARKGEALVYAAGDDGKLFIDPATGECATQILTGKIEFTIRARK